MRVFGDILPFIGFRVVNVDKDGNPAAEVTPWQAEAFEVEWLGMGTCLYIGTVWTNDDL